MDHYDVIASLGVVSGIVWFIAYRGERFFRSILYSWCWSVFCLLCATIERLHTLATHQDEWSVADELPIIVNGTSGVMYMGILFFGLYLLWYCAIGCTSAAVVYFVSKHLNRLQSIYFSKRVILEIPPRIFSTLTKTFLIATVVLTVVTIRIAIPISTKVYQPATKAIHASFPGLRIYQFRSCVNRKSEFKTFDGITVHRFRGRCEIDEKTLFRIRGSTTWVKVKNSDNRWESTHFPQMFMNSAEYRYGRCVLSMNPDHTGTLEFDFTSEPSNQREQFMQDELEISETSD